MTDVVTTLIIGFTFLLAGTVKGVIGLGLPTISLALLTVATDLPTAMALLLVPSFATNLWQALIGGSAFLLLKRLWLFLVMATVMIWVGASWFTAIKLSNLSALLGLLLITYSGISLMGFRLDLTPRQERWLGPVVGAVNGVLTGLTGSFVVPGVMFLQSIGFSRDQLIQSMGILFTLSTLALGFGLHRNNLLTYELGIASSLGLLPAIIGMILGQYIRKQMSETAFRKLFFSALLVLGMYIVVTSR